MPQFIGWFLLCFALKDISFNIKRRNWSKVIAIIIGFITFIEWVLNLMLTLDDINQVFVSNSGLLQIVFMLGLYSSLEELDECQNDKKVSSIHLIRFLYIIMSIMSITFSCIYALSGNNIETVFPIFLSIGAISDLLRILVDISTITVLIHLICSNSATLYKTSDMANCS